MDPTRRGGDTEQRVAAHHMRQHVTDLPRALAWCRSPWVPLGGTTAACSPGESFLYVRRVLESLHIMQPAAVACGESNRADKGPRRLYDPGPEAPWGRGAPRGAGGLRAVCTWRESLLGIVLLRCLPETIFPCRLDKRRRVGRLDPSRETLDSSDVPSLWGFSPPAVEPHYRKGISKRSERTLCKSASVLI